MSSGQIAPDYSFRFTTEDIHATYGSADGAFARGDFLNAAQWAPAESELKGCSLILGGLLEQGLAILDRLPTMMLRFRPSDVDDLRLFVNLDYIKGTPLKIGVATAFGGVLGTLGGSLGRLTRGHRIRTA